LPKDNEMQQKTLKLRIVDGVVNYEASGFPGMTCQDVGEQYHRKLNVTTLHAEDVLEPEDELQMNLEHEA